MVPELHSAIADLTTDLCELTRRLLKCLAIALGILKTFYFIKIYLSKIKIASTGLAEDFFLEKHKFMIQGAEQNATTFRTLFYPSLDEYCAGELGGDEAQLAAQLAGPGVVRCGQHSDYGTITLLLQDDMGGLEVAWILIDLNLLWDT